MILKTNCYIFYQKSYNNLLNGNKYVILLNIVLLNFYDMTYLSSLLINFQYVSTQTIVTFKYLFIIPLFKSFNMLWKRFYCSFAYPYLLNELTFAF